jgi:hypothetical protein
MVRGRNADIEVRHGKGRWLNQRIEVCHGGGSRRRRSRGVGDSAVDRGEHALWAGIVVGEICELDQEGAPPGGEGGVDPCGASAAAGRAEAASARDEVEDPQKQIIRHGAYKVDLSAYN